jgi:two-component system LytT family response regulator
MPMLVFVTAYDCYALDAFDVNAIDYLLKPFDEERFGKTLERVRRRRQESIGSERANSLSEVLTLLERQIHERRPELRARLLAESGGRMHVIEAERIEIVEADRNYVSLRVGRDQFHTRSTMQQAEESLASQPMLRISRSCLVNMRHVREISRTPRGDFILVTAGGTTVTSSEGFRAKVHEYLRNLKIGGG